MKNFVLSIVAMAMVMMVSCGKEPILDSVSRSNVNPTVVTDTIINTDTLFIDTTSHPGLTLLVVDYHGNYSDWAVAGDSAVITGNHKIKRIEISNPENPLDYDSVIFTERGVMRWNFPTYTNDVNGTYNDVDTNGCSGLGATCTFTWKYNVPAEYAPYFEGDCELYPNRIVVHNNSTATVYTTNGQVTKTAPFAITVNIPPTPDSTVASRSVAWRHGNDYGQWQGTGATRTITFHCWCVESTTWSTGSITKDSVLVAGHGTMTWSFPTYTQNMDRTYTASASGCTALSATCNVTESYDPANIQGRVYTHPASVHCVPIPTQVSVNGTNATVTTERNTEHGNVTRNAGYTITINIPTPADTNDIFGGHIKYWCRFYSAVNYYAPASGDAWMYLVITDDNQWYTSPDATTAAGLNFTNRGSISSSDYAYVVSVSNFTAGEKSGSRCCAAWCRNSAAGATANVFSVVRYDPNNGHAQIKYRNTSGTMVGVCSAASSTIEASNAVPEPVAEGGIKTGTGVFTFTLGGDVVK